MAYPPGFAGRLSIVTSGRLTNWGATLRRFRRSACLAILPAIAFASSQDNEATNEANEGSPAYKLTLSHYVTDSFHGDDINLRLNRASQTGWIAFYREWPTGFQQVRGGYEHADTWQAVQFVSSIQAASRGFFGGALTAQIGEPWFALLGFGRTNLKPYVNLNFDPNDAITVGAGWHDAGGASVSMFVVRDDRVVPGQQVAHLLWRTPLPAGERLTVDVFDKRGPADPGLSIRGTGAALTLDLPRVFLRLAHDPKVNFTQETMTRLSMGVRF